MLINISLDACQSHSYSNQAPVSLHQNFKLSLLLTSLFSFLTPSSTAGKVWALMSQSAPTCKYELRMNICLCIVFHCTIIEHQWVLISSVSVYVEMKRRYYDNETADLISLFFFTLLMFRLMKSLSVCIRLKIWWKQQTWIKRAWDNWSAFCCMFWFILVTPFNNSAVNLTDLFHLSNLSSHRAWWRDSQSRRTCWIFS